jgi:uncharacterized RDD family membrane protein YckC
MATYPPPPSSGPPPLTPGGPSGPRAGFWRRFAALFIDGLVIAVPGVVLIVIGAAANSGALVILGYILLVAGAIAYEIYFTGSPSGQTLGKKALGIRVVDFATGGPIGYGRSTVRLIGRYISGLVCYLGYLWMLWDKEKQCWHDKMANDVVVPVEYYPVP